METTTKVSADLGRLHSTGITGFKLLCEKTIDWRITNFQLIVNSATYVALQKLTFDVEIPDTKWTVYLKKNANSENVSVYYKAKEFKFVKGSTIIHKMEVFTVDEEGAEEEIIEMTSPVTLSKMSVDDNGKKKLSPFDVCIESLGPDEYKRYICKNGDLVLRLIFCTYEQIEEMRYISGNWKRTFLDESRTRDLELLESGEHSDCKIISSDGKVFPAHKLILRARNKVFDAMFRSDMLESNTGVIKVDDLSGDAVKCLLHFIYGSEVLPFSTNGSSRSQKTDDGNTVEIEDSTEGNDSHARRRKRPRVEKQVSLEEILYLASKYHLGNLLNFIAENMESECNQKNALRFLELSKQYSLKCKVGIVEYIKGNSALLDTLLMKE